HAHPPRATGKGDETKVRTAGTPRPRPLTTSSPWPQMSWFEYCSPQNGEVLLAGCAREQSSQAHGSRAGAASTISVTKGIAVARPRGKSLKWLMLAALAVLTAALAPQARAEGLFDFLFGGFQPRPPAPPATRSYIEPLPPVAPPSLGSESVRGGGGGGRAVAFCVRLCDGQHFPMEHITNATPVETCRAMCPASRTQVYFGNEIGGAVARDGARYTDLDNAFLYRKQLVANCTCNGRDAFGLAPFDLSSDPTLRPGDIVATKDGFAAFTGKSAKGDSFAPVKP